MIYMMMVELGERIRELRMKRRLTQEELANRLNYSRALVSLWEINKSRPDATTIRQLAELFNVSTDYLLGRTDQPQPPGVIHQVEREGLRKVPVIGRIPAGAPLIAQEDEREYLMLPEYLLPTGEIFVLHVIGNSMCGGEKPICDGDLALIQKDVEIKDKDICAIQVNGEEATLKRVHLHDDYIDLIADNPDRRKYPPAIFRTDEVTILGKLIYKLQRY